MPNWCNNNLVITGDDLTKFKAMLNGKPFTFGAFFPTPKELTDTVSGQVADEGDARAKHEAQQKANVEKYGHADWYSWNIANWGVKWDVDAEINHDTTSRMEISFDSAWAPPLTAIAQIGKMCPTLTFTLEYFECGMVFAGRYIVRGGEVTTDDSTESTKSDLWQEIAVGTFGYEPYEDDEEDADDEEDDIPDIAPSNEPKQL